MPSRRTPPSLCPTCNAYLDAADAVSDQDARPAPGDISVCAYCATVLVFDDGLKLTPMTDEAWLEVSAEMRREVSKASALVKAFQRLRGERE